MHTIFGDLFTLRQLIRFSVWRSPSFPALSSTGEDGTAWQRALKQFVPLAGSIMPILGGIIQSMVIIQHRAAVAKCSHPHSNSCTLGNCCFRVLLFAESQTLLRKTASNLNIGQYYQIKDSKINLFCVNLHSIYFVSKNLILAQPYIEYFGAEVKFN